MFVEWFLVISKCPIFLSPLFPLPLELFSPTTPPFTFMCFCVWPIKLNHFLNLT